MTIAIARNVMTTDNRTNEPRRLKSCVEAWPECATGDYNPACCRFPKSCSATVYSEEHVTEDDLEPRAALVAAQGAARQKHPTFEEIGEDIARGIRDSLSGVAPQVPNQNETKSGNNFVSLDPEKVAAIIWDLVDVSPERQDLLARALCEAYTEGKLT